MVRWDDPTSKARATLLCAWCNKVIQPGIGSARVSHGICRRCSIPLRWEAFVDRSRRRIRRWHRRIVNLFRGGGR